jgi:hypothetical protein
MKNAWKYHEKFHGNFPWNSAEFSMEFHGIFHAITWNSKEFCATEVDEISLNSMEFHGKLHGISWNCMEFLEFVEFHEIRFRQGMPHLPSTLPLSRRPAEPLQSSRERAQTP